MTAGEEGIASDSLIIHIGNVMSESCRRGTTTSHYGAAGYRVIAGNCVRDVEGTGSCNDSINSSLSSQSSSSSLPHDSSNTACRASETVKYIFFCAHMAYSLVKPEVQ